MSIAERPPGLTSEQAEEIARAVGPNELVPRERREGALWVLIKGATDPMALLLVAAAATYAVIGATVDAIITSGAVVPVVAVGLILEIRAERALARLREATRPTATVIRDGIERRIPSSEIVPGDLMVVREGDIVPADGKILETTQLSIDESALTGESLPVEKAAAGDGGEDRAMTAVRAGTVVLSGQAVVQVEATGAGTAYGRLARTVAGAKPGPTPLQKTIRSLVVRLGIVAGLFCIGVAALELAYGRGLSSAVTVGVSLGLAAVPEEFPIVFTLYLSIGAWRLSRQRALIRRLTSAESLGSTTVICTDKTGTLTEGKLGVAGLWAASGDERELLEAAVLACEPDPFDPLERAIEEHATASSVDVQRLRRADLVADHEFDPHMKYMSHVWRIGGRHMTFAKGSPESILRVAPPEAGVRRQAEEFSSEMASEGMRLIAVARGEVSGTPGDRSADESNLEFAGLVAFSDSPRPGVAEAVAACREAGIRVVMLTGDHPLTASAVAEGLGLTDRGFGGGSNLSPNSVVVGDELDSASDEEFDRIVQEATVLARIRPDQKYDIVKHLKSQGDVVAMTGDGINDAPALKEADIGVAMGMRGTEVARASADMVLLDDNFATIVAAIRNGRRIFDNLSRAFAYLVAFHIPLLLGALVIPLLRLPLLLLPLHLVLLEIVLHPTVSLAFENEPADPDVMSRPPRSPKTSLIDARRLSRPVAAGLALFGAVIGVYAISLARGFDVETARTAAFSALLAGDVGLLLAELRPRDYLWTVGRKGNRVVVPLTTGTLLLLGAVVYLPVANRIFQMSSVPLWWLAVYSVIGLGAVALTEPLKKLIRPG